MSENTVVITNDNFREIVDNNSIVLIDFWAILIIKYNMLGELWKQKFFLKIRTNWL